MKLGDRVKDRITGVKGIVICVSDWLYGCRRLVVQPEEAKDGKPVDTFALDEEQCELLQSNVVGTTQKSARVSNGPAPMPARHADPVR